VAFSPDGQRLASASHDKTVKVWDSATGHELLSLARAGPSKSVTFDVQGRLAFGPNGRLASAADETVKVWDSVTGKELLAFTRQSGRFTSVAFSPDGRCLAGGYSENRAKIWEIATGKEAVSLENAGVVGCLAFSPDGKRLAAGCWDTVKIWEWATGKELLTLKGHFWQVHSLAFSPDGQRLASGSSTQGDRTVRVWDTTTGKELYTLKNCEGLCVAFSPDGQCLASCGFAPYVTLWESTISPDLRDRRAVNRLVADAFRRMPLRTEVLDWLRNVAGMNENRRQAAMSVALTYSENPQLLNNVAWETIRNAGLDPDRYRKALSYIEQACRLEPKVGNYLNTLGVAYYRVGNYEKALETLLRSAELNTRDSDGPIPEDLAFLSMTHHRLGRSQEAQACLQRLRERMKDRRWADNADAQGFLREAETVISKPRVAGEK
jgi:WD40 repeat protein